MFKKLFGRSSHGGGGDDDETESLRHGVRPPIHVLTSPEMSQGMVAPADGDSDVELFTKESLPTLAAFFLFVFSSAAFMSIITPFLPLVLADAGANSAIVGLIFAVYPLANLCAVPLSTRLCTLLGRSKAFVMGATLEALFGILFGYAHRFAPPASIKWLYLAIRFVQGLGSSIAYTALIAWVSDRFSFRLATVLGFQEAIGGIGYMLGPTMGGVLYGLAGIALPLLLFSILVLLSLPALYWSMVEETKHDGTDIDEIDSNENHDENEGLKASELVNVTTVNSTFVTLVAAVGFGFISPVAAPHFKDVLDPNMSAGQVGLLLAIPAFLYAVVSPVSGMLSESLGYKRIMFTGMVLLLVTYVMFGPFQYLCKLFGLRQFSKGMWVDQIVSLVLLGIGAAFAFVPALPDMQKSLLHLGPDATNAIAGYFNGIYCLGEATGPLLAGLKEFLPFSRVCSIIALVHVLYVLVACYWYITTKLCQTAIKKASSRQHLEEGSDLNSPLLYNE